MITVDGKALDDAVSLVSNSVAKQTTMSILSTMLLESDGESLTLTATDFSTSQRLTIPASGDQLVTAVDAKLLAAFVSDLRDDVTIEQSASAVVIRQGASHANISGVDVADFPTIPWPESPASITMDPKILGRALARVGIATATALDRPTLLGVHLHAFENRVALSAADGYRAGREVVPVIDASELSCIMHRDAIPPLRQILDVTSDPVSITPSAGMIFVTSDHWSFGARLLEGSFPDLQHVMPKTFETTVTLARAHLLDAVKRCAPFSDTGDEKTSHIVRMTLAESVMHVEASTRGRGDLRIPVPATTSPEGADLSLRLSGKYLRDALGAFDDDSLTFGLNGYNQAVLLTPDLAALDSMYMLMPIVTGGE